MKYGAKKCSCFDNLDVVSWHKYSYRKNKKWLQSFLTQQDWLQYKAVHQYLAKVWKIAGLQQSAQKLPSLLTNYLSNYSLFLPKICYFIIGKRFCSTFCLYFVFLHIIPGGLVRQITTKPCFEFYWSLFETSFARYIIFFFWPKLFSFLFYFLKTTASFILFYYW